METSPFYDARPFRVYARCARYPTTTVYHYTDRGGLVGILDSGELRATDISYMNDARESVHGSD